MKLSVCMATRNGERWIGEQLSSILRQLGPEDEVVVSDDSSTDATTAIVRGFGDARIRLWDRQAFFSPIFNFEHALRKATGDVLVLSDQDDVWLDGKVDVIRERFARPPHRIFAVVLDGEVVDEAGRVTEASIFAKIHAGPGILKNLYDNTFLGCCMAFSRPLLDLALPFPRDIPMHDMWLGQLAQLTGRVEFVPVKTIRYRKHAASTTRFEREFIPLVQIRRRWAMASNLARRWAEARRRPG